MQSVDHSLSQQTCEATVGSTLILREYFATLRAFPRSVLHRGDSNAAIRCRIRFSQHSELRVLARHRRLGGNLLYRKRMTCELCSGAGTLRDGEPCPLCRSGGMPRFDVLQIPHAVGVEHEALYQDLISATRAPGETGLAAAKVIRLFHPHFLREERLAIPQLALLRPLSNGTPISRADVMAAYRRAESLEREIPAMLEEHQSVRGAIDQMKRTAIAEGVTACDAIATHLLLHMELEEEVLYPAALLVGSMIRASSRSETLIAD